MCLCVCVLVSLMFREKIKAEKLAKTLSTKCSQLVLLLLLLLLFQLRIRSQTSAQMRASCNLFLFLPPFQFPLQPLLLSLSSYFSLFLLSSLCIYITCLTARFSTCCYCLCVVLIEGRNQAIS